MRTFTAGALIGLALMVPGCASMQSVGEDYAGRGLHELATYYFAGVYLADKEDEDNRAQLIKSVEAAAKKLDADYDTAKTEGRFDKALAIASRKEELYAWAANLGLGEFDTDGGSALVKEALGPAAKLVISTVDKAESEGKPADELLRLLRTAMAMNPNDSEMAARYRRMQTTLTKNIAVRTECGFQDLMACQRFEERLLAHILGERREITKLVPGSSQVKNAELRIRVTSQHSDSGWQRTRGGKLKEQVEKRDRFNEVEKDKNGRPVQVVVTASYELFERTAQATAVAEVQIADLREGAPEIFSKREQAVEQDKRAYYTWDGDERALTSLKSVGTNQTPPRTREELLRAAWEKAADAVAQAILKKLEG